MINVESFTKIYSKSDPPAVNEVSFQVKDGEILGFAGLNGAGKTTTIRSMGGIILPSSGNIMVNGHNIVTEKIKASREIGWVPEFPNFEPNARPIPLLRYYAGFYGIKGDEATKLAESLMEQVDLKRAIRRKVRGYSQGMKKRFALAAAMLSNPGNFLFDETLNGLDPEGINYMRKLMTRLRDEGKAVFLSTHILSELENLADRILVIHRGKLIDTLSRDRMRSLGKPVLKVRVNRMDGDAEKIMEKYGKTVVDNDTATVMEIQGGEEIAGDLNYELMQKGYRVTMLDMRGESLEEYFFHLVGDHK